MVSLLPHGAFRQFPLLAGAPATGLPILNASGFSVWTFRAVMSGGASSTRMKRRFTQVQAFASTGPVHGQQNWLETNISVLMGRRV